ncbi:hypothetical protein B1B04_21050 [Lysinibacillus sp. KCTC 33748]|uniref:hypothetical protein n=1 Tax=unclassified Lysinibacillus TaxID=2636778 RepID=UPI0009A6F65B|nr:MULTISPECIES: hypothetical protein [unclassified Lysinibacillus]OXS68431.1 hypothetical protein B1B04_21050 [Lysinibacillus sp. KCTC 33748]SKC11489.1 hypothetical protein SAMN06295926_12464 [Lysinibacillus sp. AC-3]
MKKNIIYFAIGSSILLLFYTVFKLIGNESSKLALITYGSFTVIFIYSLIYSFQKKWVPIIIQLITLLIVLVVPPLIRTEVNFYFYKDDRDEIISMLVNGEIKKEANRYGAKGFYSYYTPPQYIDAVKSETIRVGMHSKDHFFVYFQSAEPPFMDMQGLQEGFIFSSTGKFPTAKEFDYYSDYKKIDDHWYFVSSDVNRFEKSCLFLCE